MNDDQFSEIINTIKEVSASNAPSKLQKNHHRIAIAGTIVTLCFGIVTFWLTNKFSNNEEQIKILRQSYEISHMPFLEANISFSGKFDPILTIEFVNNGGPLKDLEIKKIKANESEIDFTFFKDNFARRGKFTPVSYTHLTLPTICSV